jgi:hypothetical protein
LVVAEPLPSLSPAGILNSKATDEIWLEVVAGTDGSNSV